MNINILQSQLGETAAHHAAGSIRRAHAAKETARVIFATGASQFEFLAALTAVTDLDWPHVEMFHLDEYIGLPVTHPASFRKYLHERLLEKVPIARYHLLDGEGDPIEVIRQVNAEIRTAPVDLAIVGIGENGHLAFNDPPADFEIDDPYIVVTLDKACRRQQVGEGWFANIDEVPTQAISMSIRQIMRSKEIICIAPDSRKAAAVRATLEDEISPLVPASILREHPTVTMYLNRDSAALLTNRT